MKEKKVFLINPRGILFSFHSFVSRLFIHGVDRHSEEGGGRVYVRRCNDEGGRNYILCSMTIVDFVGGIELVLTCAIYILILFIGEFLTFLWVKGTK